MKRLVSFLSAAALFSLSPLVTWGAETITLIGGSTSIAAVINPVKAPFEKTTGITVNATAAGSKVAMQKLDAGEAEVATAGHTFEELLDNLKKSNVTLKNPVDSFTVIKLAEPTTYGVVVNPKNPVSKLSKEQLAGIFSGKITNWKEVGGNDSPILCVVSTLSPGTNEAFQKTFLDGKKISVDFLDASSAADLKQTVASNPDAVGFIADAMVDGTVRKVETLTMKSAPIIMITVGKPLPKVQKLADFILGEGKKYLR